MERQSLCLHKLHIDNISSIQTDVAEPEGGEAVDLSDMVAPWSQGCCKVGNKMNRS